LEHAHRALEQLQTEGLMANVKAKALEYAQRAAKYVNLMSSPTTLTNRKHELEASLRTCTNDTDKLKWTTELNKIKEQLAELANEKQIPTKIEPQAQMRTNPYCVG
jgi:hypothetical protein